MTDHDRLAGLALEMVARIRDIDPERNRTWLEAQQLTWEETWALLWTLAAMVDPDASTHQLFGWTWGLSADGLLAEQFGPGMPRDLPRRRAAS